MIKLRTRINPHLIVMKDGKVVAKFQPVEFARDNDGNPVFEGQFLTKDEELSKYIQRHCKHAEISRSRLSQGKLNTVDGKKRRRSE